MRANMRKFSTTAWRSAQSVRQALERRALLAPLLLALMAAFSAWAFIELADEVVDGETDALDRRLLLALRHADDPGDPWGPWWLELTMRDLTALGSTAVLTLVTLAAAGYLLLMRRAGAALMVACAVGGGLAASHGLKWLIERPRPDLVPHGVPVLTLSFPSGHATMSAVVYLTLGVLLASLQPSRRAALYLLGVAVLLTVLVGFSRVYLGVHWPSDVLAGWSLGAAWAAACLLVSQWLRRRSGQAGGA
jgi:undecaprenyl-diphosphatase